MVARFRWLVLALWIAFVAVSAYGAIHVKSRLISGGIVVKDSESDRGGDVLSSEFGRVPTKTAAAVFRSERFKVSTDPQFKAGVEKALQNIKDAAPDSTIRSFYTTGLARLKSEDDHTTYAVIDLVGDEEEVKKQIPTIREALQKDFSPDLDEAHIMGFPAVSQDITAGSAEDLEKAEKYSLPLTVFLLLIVFGTIVAAGLPVILGAAAVVTALGALYLVTYKMETSIFAMNTASMIGLGLGIDFSLLMVSRFREELARGMDAHRATVRTVQTAGKSIVFSGLTVMLGLSVMLLYPLVLVRSIALGMLIVAGLAVLGAVTLLPALMCMFGRGVNSGNLIPGRQAGGRPQVGTGRWHAWSLLVMRYPWLFLFLALALLLAMSWPFRDMNAIGAGGAQGVGEEADSRKGFELLTKSFPIGEVAPIDVIVKTNKKDGVNDPAFREGIFKLTETIANEKDRVARVESISNLQPGMTLEQFKQVPLDALMGTGTPNAQRQKALVSQFINVDGNRDVFHISIIAKEAEVAPETTGLVTDIRTKFGPDTKELKGTEILVAGQTALTLDYRDELFNQFPKLVGLVLLVTYFVLLLFFHSLILPLKAILMNLIGITASYGFLVMVFEWGILDKILGFEHLGRLTMFPPVILFSILFGLSTDYEVFLLSRVKEIYEREKHKLDMQYGGRHDAAYVHRLNEINEHSVAEGLERTAGIITAAGLIMIVVFAAFAMGQVLVVKELGAGLSMAVLLDSTIIRVILVPVSMKLMGHLNWWMPAALDWIPHIREGGDEEEEMGQFGPDGQMHRRPARFCGQCGAVLPEGARFCGRCGRVLNVGPQFGQSYPGDGGQYTHTPGYDRPDPGLAMQGQSSLLAQGAMQRIPIVLRVGRAEQRAWLNLRDCHVEKDPSMPNVPIVSVEGLDVRPVPGQQPPEIQIRNARIRY
ncbi:MAG: MMPL family transporter [Chloroflexota bacterium]